MSRSVESRLIDGESYSVRQFHLYVKVELLPEQGDELLGREPVVPGCAAEALRFVLCNEPLHEVCRLVAELTRVGDDKGDKVGSLRPGPAFVLAVRNGHQVGVFLPLLPLPTCNDRANRGAQHGRTEACHEVLDAVPGADVLSLLPHVGRGGCAHRSDVNPSRLLGGGVDNVDIDA